MSDDRRLERPAADYVAGDLDAAEADRFAQQLAEDPDLAAEVAYWERIGPLLREAGRPAGARPPGPGLIAAVRHRATRETTAGGAGSPAAWWRSAAIAGWTAAAAAILTAVLVGGIGGPQDSGSEVGSTADPLAFDESGARLLFPSGAERRAEHRFANQRIERDELASASSVEERPWLGVWTQPVDLQGFEHDHGLRILHVAAGSPAQEAGLRPGDILVALADCPLMSRYCISNAFDQTGIEPGDEIGVLYYRAATGERVERSVSLGRAWE